MLTDGWELSSIVAVQTGTPFWAIDNRPPDVMCNQGGSPTPCSSAAAGSPVITPNVLAPDSGDYNLDGVNYDIPISRVETLAARTVARRTSTGCSLLPTLLSLRRERRVVSHATPIATPA